MLIFGNGIFLASQFGSVPAESSLLSVYGAIDTIGHLVLYFGLGFFVARYISVGMQLGPAGVLVITSALCLLFGFFDEMHQAYVPGRSAEFRDLTADLLGGVGGGFVYMVLAGLAGWAREMVCSAQVGLRTVLVRAAVGLSLIVAVCAVAVVHATATSGFVFALAMESSWFVTQTVDSIQKAYAARSADKSCVPASLAVPALAAGASAQQGTGFSSGQSEIASRDTRPARATQASEQRPAADPKKDPVQQAIHGIAQDIEREVMNDIAKASKGMGKSSPVPEQVGPEEKTVSRTIGQSGEASVASQKSLVRNKIISALAARGPQIEKLAGGIVGRERPEANRIVLGVSDKQPEKCDLVAVIANPENPVTEISLDQARKLFSGEYNNWCQVGGPDLPITVVTVRKRSAEVEESLKAHLKAPISPKATRLPLVGLIIPVVAENKGAVGFLPIQNTEQLDFVAQHQAFKRIAIRPEFPQV